jgi:PEP-CTERM/exosortase A-associated glycosyltransferase
MRILHILDHSIPLHSGYTFRTRNILREQRRRGWETAHVTSLKQGPCAAAEEEVDGLRFYRTAPSRNPVYRLPLLDQWAVVETLARRIIEVAAAERPDILHAHSPALNGLAALRAGRHLGLPVVYECRAFWEDAAVDHGTSTEGGLRYRATRALETRVFRRANAVTTICEGLRGDIVARGIVADKVTVIPNAVNIEEFGQAREPDPALREQLGLVDKRVLGFIGSFYAYEGLPLLVEALPAILASDPGVRLLLVGGGPDEARIRERSRALGVEEAIVLTGRVPHREVQAYYDLVDILVYPRLPMRLTDLVTPLKPLEAMAEGRLVVASDVGGHRELIEDGVTGRLFKAGDAGALAATIVALLGDREAWPAFHAAGRRYVAEERNWGASVARYEAVYQGLPGV